MCETPAMAATCLMFGFVAPESVTSLLLTAPAYPAVGGGFRAVRSRYQPRLVTPFLARRDEPQRIPRW